MRRSLATALALLGLLLGSARPARAETPPAETGVLTRAPAVVEPAEPEYPEAARAAGLTGVVTLELEISETGEVTDAVVTGPAGQGFDEAAVAAARKLRFSPAEIDGAPAPVRIEYRFTFALAAPPAAPAPPPLNLLGRVLERGTRLPVAGAMVEAGGQLTHTDGEGRFALAGVADGAVQVVVTDVDHARLESEETVEPGKATQVTYWLQRTAAEGEYEAVVVGEREEKEVSHVAIAAGEIRRVAGASGDAVKVIQNLPGMARTFLSGEMIVRGGNARDTRVYVDGEEVPAVFHFGGLTSVYSSELLKDVEFEAGNFGVRSGRAIGGRVNLVTRDPGERTHTLADVNLYHATALYEGRPREDLGIAIAARRSYADAVVTRALESMDDAPGVSTAPRYYDLQAKAAWKATADDTVRLDVFGSDDRMVLTGVEDDQSLEDLDFLEYGTRFYRAGLRWDHRASEATRLRLALGGGWQDMDIDADELFRMRQELWSTHFRAEVNHELTPRVKLVTGVDGQWYPRVRIEVDAPPILPPGQVPNPNAETRRYAATIDGLEAGAFVEATLEPVDGLFVVPGVRADVHRALANLSWVDPRLAVRWQLRPGTALKGAVGLYHQAPPFPYVTEEFGNPDLREEGAWQYSLGAEQRLLPRLLLDAQLYYKRLFDLALPSDAVITRDGQLVSERYRSAGTGRSYGAELLLRWDPDGRFFGWISYSLSRAERGESVAGGRLDSEGDAYDQPHNVVAVGTVELPEVWRGLSAGFRARYTSGNPYEPVRAAVYDADADRYQPIQTGALTGRMPPFFQLDLRVDKKWTARTWTFAAYLEVQNVTNRENPEAAAYSFDYSRRGWYSGLPLFPSFGLRAEY
ncbi:MULTISPECIES: TonB-dependent receptor domain-containing protein [Anaeromyxobacter]|uniref:TonB-dependent receptor domain-containing protein n=1 Tax=Anaeromyxobacter TaxID=161492 RepID=UPI001F5ABF17|nr:MULTISPECIES: TonB-dependent receptor [unclassified Anaeromyxobacter]